MMYSTPRRLCSLQRLSSIGMVALLTILLTSCGDLTSFTFTETSQEVTVEGSGLSQLPVDNPLGEALNLDIDLDQELAARDATGASAVYLDSLVFRITDTEMPEGDTDDFNFLDSLELYASADGMDRKLVASIEDVPQDVQRISLDTDTGVDLKPYVEQGMRLQATGQGSIPDDDTSVEAVATIRVHVL